MQRSPQNISCGLQLNWCRWSREGGSARKSNKPSACLLSSPPILQSLAHFRHFMLTHIYSRQEKFISAMCMAWVPLGALLCMPYWTWWASQESRMAALQVSWAIACCPWWSCPLLQSSSHYSKYQFMATGIIWRAVSQKAGVTQNIL